MKDLQRAIAKQGFAVVEDVLSPQTITPLIEAISLPESLEWLTTRLL